MQGSDVAFILEFLRQHDLKGAEEALRNELAAKGNLLLDSPVVKASGKVSGSGNGSINQLGLGPAAPSIEDAIPQGLAPVRIHSSHDLLKAGEEPVEEKGKRKSVSDLSMVPPPLPIAEPVTSPAISPPTHESSSGSIKHHNVPTKHKPQGLGNKNHKQPGAADGKAAGFKPTWARRESTEKAEPAEPTSLQQAREMLLGLAMGGDQASGARPAEEEWDSDEYEDEDDVGYHRQAIEDEEAFLANEIETPPDEDEGRRTSAGGEGAREKKEGIGDDPSFQEEAYFSGEEYYKLEGKPQEDDDETSSEASIRELEQVQAKALSRQSSGLGDESAVVEVEDFGILTTPEGVAERQRPGEGDERARKKGLADLLQKLTAKPAERTSNGRPAEGIPDSEKLTGVEAEAAEAAAVLAQYEKAAESAKRAPRGNEGAPEEGLSGFSFPEPASVDIAPQIILETGGKPVWSVDDLSPARTDPEANTEFPPLAMPDADDMLAGFLRKSNETSPVASPKEEVRNEDNQEDIDDDRGDSMRAEEGDDDIDVALEEGDEDAAVHEQLQRMKAEEEEFEVFDLRVIHRKNRTGFEEEKDFPVQLNAVVAGRYHVTEYLGSAAFSKAIQAHDLQSGMDVCMKIIKNNKDFFDQSLDEIKLLKYINKHDPADEHHILRLYDYFYHREHLFIVCELLRANLYEFHKYNRESGGEVYFTMARIQCITVQILEALHFLHGLGLLHCDLKPENILVKSYSRCEIKVIDLGSSCFATDHLCSYVQSRSYRAPEVILGLPYSHKIDIWSLGCILAELCSGTVLFQNDSLATLLARVVGILGPIDPAMLARGKDTHKYFTKANMLYERNQETDRLEYLIPKKTSLRHRLPTGDAGFTEFVSTLLETNPEKRPSAEEALRHPWLKFPYEPFN